MAEDAKEAWNDVGERFASWGRGVADRYRGSQPADADSAEETQRKLEQAARDLKNELTRGFTAVSETFRDDKAKKDLMDAVSSIGDAITATVNEASAAIRRGSSPPGKPPASGPSDDAGDTGSAPPPAPES
jgi:hypothetical protein